MAYLFYGFIYVHVLVLFIPKLPNEKRIDVVVYGVAFVLYYILLFKKYRKMSQKKRANESKLIS